MTMGRARRLGKKLRPSLVGDGTIGLERKTGGLLRSDIDANVRGIRVSPSRTGMQAMLRGAVVVPIDTTASLSMLAADSLSFGLRALSGTEVTVLWGDGAETTQTVGPDANVTFSRTYGSAYTGLVNVVVPLGISRIRRLDLGFSGTSPGNSVRWTTQQIGAFSGLTHLILNLGGNLFGGDVVFLPDTLEQLTVNGSGVVSGVTSDLPAALLVLFLAASNTLGGGTAGFPRGLLSATLFGAATVAGLTTDLPPDMTSLSFQGQTALSGPMSGLPRLITSLDIGANASVFGPVSDLPPPLVTCSISTTGDVSGTAAGLPATVNFLSLTGASISFAYDPTNFPTPITFASIVGGEATGYSGTLWRAGSITRLVSTPSAGGLLTAEVDDLIIDMNAQSPRPNNGVLTLTGTNEPRTSTSDAAVTALQGAGWTVSVPVGASPGAFSSGFSSGFS